MTTASELRRGLAFVEIGIDEAYLRAELGKAQAQVGQFADKLRSVAAGAKMGMGPAGEDPWGATPPMFVQGLRVATAINLVTAGFKGMTEGMREGYGAADALDKIFESLPMGVGEYYGALRSLLAELNLSAQAFRNFGEAAATRGKFATGLLEIAKIRKQLALTEEDPRRAAILESAKKSGMGEGHIKVQMALAELDKKQAQERLDARIAAWTKEQDALAGFQMRARTAGLAGDELELANLDERFKRESAEWKGHYEHLAAITAAYLTDRAGILDRAQADADKKAGEKRWQEIEEAGDRLAGIFDEQVQEIQNFSRELDALAESVQTPAERIRALQDNLITRLGLDPSGELYRRLMDKTLGEFAEEGLRDAFNRTSQVRGTYCGREAGLLGRGGGAADAIAENTKETAIAAKKIALAAEAGFRWSN